MIWDRRFGWVPDVPDIRDFPIKLLLGARAVAKLPEQVDLRKQCPPIYDQGALASCTAHAAAAAFDCAMKRSSRAFLDPSRLFVYYMTRLIEGTIREDAGAQNRNAIKALVRYGAPEEWLWPYYKERFAKKPTARAVRAAERYQVLGYNRVPTGNIGALRAALASGLPVVFGFSVYESFDKVGTGKRAVVTMPKSTEYLQGGHAVLAVGYDHKVRRVLVRNSWGTYWGDKGYFWMPYDYVGTADLADDFWVVKEVE